MVRTAASSEPAAQAKSLPFMSLVDASSMQHEDDEPEQMMRELSIGDRVQTENFNQNNVQQVLLKHLHLQLTELNAQLQDAFLWLQEEWVLGSNTLGNTKTHLHLICLQTSPQHYISFV
jgi:small-conductance mechanosensitive channel